MPLPIVVGIPSTYWLILGMALAMYKLSSIFISGTGTAKDAAKGIA